MPHAGNAFRVVEPPVDLFQLAGFSASVIADAVRNAIPAPAGRAEWRTLPPTRCRAGHGVRFPAADSPCRQNTGASAGTSIGSGTVSNKLDGSPGKSIADGGDGFSCIAETRIIETIETDAPATPYLRLGDRVKIEVRDRQGASVFGAIEQTVLPADGVSPASQTYVTVIFTE